MEESRKEDVQNEREVGCCVTTRKINTSIIVTIPKSVVELKKIKPGQVLEIKVR